MLLIHQAGSVKVGEVVRYTLTYTPSDDRILPSPAQFHVKIRNTSSIPLRAAYLHGPYALHVSAYPFTFSPHRKLENPRLEGLPQFEPNLKAGGSWIATLTIPENIRESGEKANIKRNIDGSPKTVTWIIEIASQIIFSNTATVNYELLVGRDRRSLDLGFAAVASKGHGEPGSINDFRGQRPASSPRHAPPKGVYSKAVNLIVEDTAALWNKPALPQMDFEQDANEKPNKKPPKKRKLHLVILTHGMHSNLGADMLYMKESIDSAAKQAHDNAKREKALRLANRKNPTTKKPAISAPATPIHNPLREEEDDSDDEQVLVRGFNGNAVRTERGIQYLGKRLAKYILTTTYPDQPFLPASKSMTKAFTASLTGSSKSQSNQSSQQAGSMRDMAAKSESLPYTFTSISFVGHSLGGLIQTYAIAYIHKHSPDFFNRIKPVNFVAMASPLLGLSNENPLYVKFALDFGLVGRTGQDLGLTWRAPTIARSGWSAMISGFGGGGSEKEGPKEDDPRSKPLLRILPTGPAHEVLKMFRNRTVYSNVVNDGIVPLRTSCLLFLDWRGLGKVENARRDNGLIGTMAAFGWAELTGANSTSHRPTTARLQDDEESEGEQGGSGSPKGKRQDSLAYPEPENTLTHDRTRGEVEEPEDHHLLSHDQAGDSSSDQRPSSANNSTTNEADNQMNASSIYALPNNPLTDFINLFRPAPSKSSTLQSPKVSKKTAKTFKRAQTIKLEQNEAEDVDDDGEKDPKDQSSKRPGVTRGDSLLEDPNSAPPPKTSILDSAGDIINPRLPPESWLIDPSSRSRAIFHDRIYYPQDIPPPPPRRPKSTRSFSSSEGMQTKESSQSSANPSIDTSSGMRVEEKIARAYHNGMPWRKVLVRLEPDAHNNIIVRRMFANAFGWDVVKHLCDTHFANLFSSGAEEDVKPLELGSELSKTVSESDLSIQKPQRTDSELQEERDHVSGLEVPQSAHGSLASRNSYPKLRTSRSQESAWNDSLFDDTEEDYANNSDEEINSHFDTFQRFWASRSPKHGARRASDVHPNNLNVQTQLPKTSNGKDATIADQLTQSPLPVSAQGRSKIEPPQSVVKPTFEAESVQPLMTEQARPDTLAETNQNASASMNTAELGLHKPPEAVLASQRPPSSGLTRDPNVTEAVARATLSSPDKQTE